MLTMRRVVWGRPILSEGPTVMDGHIRQCDTSGIGFRFYNTLRIITLIALMQLLGM
jgi:hypothetical protein